MNPPEVNQTVQGSLDQSNSKPEHPNSTGHGTDRPTILSVLNTCYANGKKEGPGHHVPLMLQPLGGVTAAGGNAESLRYIRSRLL